MSGIKGLRNVEPLRTAKGVLSSTKCCRTSVRLLRRNNHNTVHKMIGPPPYGVLRVVQSLQGSRERHRDVLLASNALNGRSSKLFSTRGARPRFIFRYVRSKPIAKTPFSHYVLLHLALDSQNQRKCLSQYLCALVRA